MAYMYIPVLATSRATVTSSPPQDPIRVGTLEVVVTNVLVSASVKNLKQLKKNDKRINVHSNYQHLALTSCSARTS